MAMAASFLGVFYHHSPLVRERRRIACMTCVFQNYVIYAGYSGVIRIFRLAVP
jgi:hypothetical protein